MKRKHAICYKNHLNLINLSPQSVQFWTDRMAGSVWCLEDSMDSVNSNENQLNTLAEKKCTLNMETKVS